MKTMSPTLAFACSAAIVDAALTVVREASVAAIACEDAITHESKAARINTALIRFVGVAMQVSCCGWNGSNHGTRYRFLIENCQKHRTIAKQGSLFNTKPCQKLPNSLPPSNAS